ncbi:glycosyltransferase family 4 protein [Fictibacillus nanhaiensis]|uniref:Glycosyltransferase family 4 protein n=1 Tax=Fictibacillus nanhaiensis TaxID=742169 RepID=A0ABS2ZM99_9BACL|nr:glycosyltransferase family 4 protein [Fictibacillus nanhaiensis]
MKKILIVSTVSRQFYLFEQGNIEVLNSLGYEVHTAANFSDANERLDVLNIKRHHFDIERNPFTLKNIKAYKQLKGLMKSENFDAVHCHSPMGGVLARLAAESIGISPVIYTAHGFHFYKGAPIINWLLYYPIEKVLSRYTDVLITINKEDYKSAQRFKAKNVIYIPGIGIESNRYSNIFVDKKNKLKELGITSDAYVILSVGELNENKNHEVIIKALSNIRYKNFIYLICGQGDRADYLMNLANSLGISNKVKLLGFRNDVIDLYKVADIFAFPSYREGLSVSLMEAMSAGLPVVCSSVRGNTDLIQDGQGGFLNKPTDIEGFGNSLDKLINNTEMRILMGEKNLQEIEKYDSNVVKEKMKMVYENKRIM